MTDLKSIKKIFPKNTDCIKFLEEILWQNEPVCPYCPQSSPKAYVISPLGDRYHCNSCNTSFSVTAKTIFARTRCDLRKWFLAIYLLYSPRSRITVRELADAIKTTKDTAWLIQSKIDKAKIESPYLLETIVGKIDSIK